VKRYDWILFDADNTLFDYYKSEGEALRRAFASFGLPYTDDILPIYKEVNDPLWKRFERGEIQADFIRDYRFELLLKKLGQVGDSRALNEAYLEALGAQTQEMEGARETVEALEGRYMMGIVTNGLSTVQRKRFSLSPLARFFPVIIVSEETGFTKPDPAIFEAALSKMGSPPKERVLMVGDSLSADIAGAIASGIDSCWVDRERPELEAVPEPDYRIHKIGEVREILR
jgi:YjjG family noncanonical pyrimidine nucleotidase